MAANMEGLVAEVLQLAKVLLLHSKKCKRDTSWGKGGGGSYILGSFTNPQGSKCSSSYPPRHTLSRPATGTPGCASPTRHLQRLLAWGPSQQAHALPTYVPVQELPGCNLNTCFRTTYETEQNNLAPPHLPVPPLQ